MRLKQKLAFGLCSLYLFSVIGIALSMHFCGGKLASVAVYSSKVTCKFCKTKAADPAENGCCKNTKVELKVKDNHQFASSFKLPKLFIADHIFEPFAPFILKNSTVSFVGKFENKAPPSARKVALYLFNCVFRN